MKSRFWPTLLSVTALIAASLVAASSAQGVDAPAKWEPATILYAKVVRAEHTHVHVKSRYRCFGGNNERTHIFVSVKQGPKISKMSLEQLIEAQGTSSISKAWYNSNIGKGGQQAPNITANCDGKFHTGYYKIRRQPALTDQQGNPVRNLGYLKNGRVFLQYCLIDSFATQDENDPTGVNWEYSKPYIHVHGD